MRRYFCVKKARFEQAVMHGVAGESESQYGGAGPRMVGADLSADPDSSVRAGLVSGQGRHRCLFRLHWRRNLLGAATVITSYSIHYTKLYDPGFHARHLAAYPGRL